MDKLNSLRNSSCVPTAHLKLVNQAVIKSREPKKEVKKLSEIEIFERSNWLPSVDVAIRAVDPEKKDGTYPIKSKDGVIKDITFKDGEPVDFSVDMEALEKSHKEVQKERETKKKLTFLEICEQRGWLQGWCQGEFWPWAIFIDPEIVLFPFSPQEFDELMKNQVRESTIETIALARRRWKGLTKKVASWMQNLPLRDLTINEI